MQNLNALRMNLDAHVLLPFGIKRDKSLFRSPGHQRSTTKTIGQRMAYAAASTALPPLSAGHSPCPSDEFSGNAHDVRKSCEAPPSTGNPRA